MIRWDLCKSSYTFKDRTWAEFKQLPNDFICNQFVFAVSINLVKVCMTSSIRRCAVAIIGWMFQTFRRLFCQCFATNKRGKCS